ncbi:hypothetical protein FRC07_004940 [Ceratobasidium sp. 392]|nr:hypothetical protein FRC07_004940 [Ceratobasidium sp. 392]
MVLLTGPISMLQLQALGKVEIVAKRLRNSNLQASQGHWKNFVVKIYRQRDSKPDLEDEQIVSDMEWQCFEREALKEKSDQRHMVINQKHKLWDHFRPGDRLEIGLKDYPWVRPEDHYEVSVHVWDLWKPSSKVLALA